MKKGIALLILLLFSATIYSQGVKFNSFSITPLSFYIHDSPENKVVGFAVNADISFSYNKNLFSIYAGAGIEIVFPEINIEKGGGHMKDPGYYDEIDLLYGREFQITNWFKLETHAGLGRMHIKIYEFNEYDNVSLEVPYDNVSLGVPLRLKTLFYIGKHFSLGFNPNVNFSKDFITSSFGIIFQYKL